MSDQNDTTEELPVMQRRSKRRWPWFVVGIAVIVTVLGLTFPNSVWDGRVHRTIRVRVSDNSMGYPVEDATVTLMERRDQVMSEHLDPALTRQMLEHSHHLAMTNKRGEATLTAEFGAGGSDRLFFRSGGFVVDGVLSVSHPKYRSADGMLKNYLQRTDFPLSTKNLELRIYLERK